MANSGPDNNGSQFYISLRATPWLDNNSVVFGEVIHGFEIISKAAEIAKDDPSKIKIVDSGEFY